MDLLLETASLKTQISKLYAQLRDNPKLSRVENFRIEEEIRSLTLRMNLLNLELNALRNEKNIKALNA